MIVRDEFALGSTSQHIVGKNPTPLKARQVHFPTTLPRAAKRTKSNLYGAGEEPHGGPKPESFPASPANHRTWAWYTSCHGGCMLISGTPCRTPSDNAPVNCWDVTCSP